MAWERISKVLETPDGAFVYAQGDYPANQFRVICSACPDLERTRYKASAGAILAASFHAEHDPAQQFVPTRK